MPQPGDRRTLCRHLDSRRRETLNAALAKPANARPAHSQPETRNGAVAQMGERSNRTAEVRGSIPLGSTKPPFRSIWRRLGFLFWGAPPLPLSVGLVTPRFSVLGCSTSFLPRSDRNRFESWMTRHARALLVRGVSRPATVQVVDDIGMAVRTLRAATQMRMTDRQIRVGMGHVLRIITKPEARCRNGGRKGYGCQRQKRRLRAEHGHQRARERVGNKPAQMAEGKLSSKDRWPVLSM